jgi:cell division protein FtsQ
MKGKLNRKALNRKKPGLFRLYLKLGLVLFILLLAGGAYAYVRFAKEALPISRIEIYGNKNLTQGELLELLSVKNGDNLFRYASKDLADRLLTSAWVKSASVRKELLNLKLLLRVEEREPFVLIKKNGALFISDVTGKLLERLGDNTTPFLPVLEAESNPESFREAVVLARLLKERGYFEKSVTITAPEGPETLEIKIDGVTVKVGYGEYEEKLEKLKELEAEINRRGIPAESIDLRFANRVIVTPLSEVPE